MRSTDIVATHLRGERLYQVMRWQPLGVCHGFGTRDIPLERYMGKVADDGRRLKPLSVFRIPYSATSIESGFSMGVERRFGLRTTEYGRRTTVWVADDIFIPPTHQVHSNVVHCLDRPMSMPLYIGDAFVTDARGIVCAVRTADCVPVLLYAPQHGVVGAVHAGWRGLASGILTEAVEVIQQRYRVSSSQLEVAIGPAVDVDDYEVDGPVLTAFKEAGRPLREGWQPTRRGHGQLDLGCVAWHELMAAGVPEGAMRHAPVATSSRPGEFHSVRRRANDPGRQWSFIYLR